MQRLMVYGLIVAAGCLNVFPIARVAFADAGKCCTGTENVKCSGCKKLFTLFGNDFHAKLGVNTTRFCEDYVNPIVCDDTQNLECWSAMGRINLYSDANCTMVNGGMDDPSLSMPQCPQDSCD